MQTPKSADCPKFLDQLERLVDGCMEDSEEKEFLQAISKNVQCIEKLEVERAFKDFLSKKLERKCCSESLLNNIQNCIENER